jgi:hypothetical protein
MDLAVLRDEHRVVIIDRHKRPQSDHVRRANRDHAVKREDELINPMPLLDFGQATLRGIEGAVFGRHDVETWRAPIGIPKALHTDRRLGAVLGEPAMDPIEMR